MTGIYIHADGSACHHGLDPDDLGTLDPDPDLDHDIALMPPVVHCAGGRPLTGYRLDPDQPAP